MVYMNKAIVNWKYPKSAVCLTHPTQHHGLQHSAQLTTVVNWGSCESEEAHNGDSVARHTADLRKKDSACSSTEYITLLDSHTNEL